MSAELASLQAFLTVGAALFGIGLIGFLSRRNMIVMFLSAEMMLQGVSLSLVAWGRYHSDLGGQMLVIFIIAVAACEAAIALAVVLMLFERKGTPGHRHVGRASRVEPAAFRGGASAAAARRQPAELAAPDTVGRVAGDRVRERFVSPQGLAITVMEDYIPQTPGDDSRAAAGGRGDRGRARQAIPPRAQPLCRSCWRWLARAWPASP